MLGPVLSQVVRVSLTEKVTCEQMPEGNEKVKLITEEKAFHKEGPDPLVPIVGLMPDVFKELKEASVTERSVSWWERKWSSQQRARSW